MKRVLMAFQICMLLAAGLTACGRGSALLGFGHHRVTRSPHETTDNPMKGPGSGPPVVSVSPELRGVQVVHLAFDVLRIELPIGTIRHSRKVWNHVDELRLDAQLVARLARNGIRVGVASADAWPALDAIIAAAGGSVISDQLMEQPGAPSAIRIASIRDSETVFHYGRENRLVGKTFQRGDKLISLDYAFHPELGQSTDVRITFEIRHDWGALRWDRRGDTIRQVPAFERHTFADLSVLLTLKPGEFLVVGPSGETKNTYLVGARFFVSTGAGHDQETIICITPRTYRTPRPPQGSIRASSP